MAYDIIREGILDGTLPPGMKLRQETLADSIGISRVPVRSALIQLEADGLVEVLPRRGAVVRALSLSEANEVYQLRILLEREALRISMSEMNPERLEHLRELAQRADDTSEGSEFVAARTAFYSALYDSEHRPLTWELIEQLRLKLGRYVLGWRLVSHSDHHESHSHLMDMIASGDVEGSSAMLEAHLTRVRDGVIALLKEASGDLEDELA